MSHYFTDNRELAKNRREITFRFLDLDYKLVSSDGVFSKDKLDYGTYALLKVLVKQNLYGNIADLGCGYGPLSVVLSQEFKNLSFSGFDINPLAVELANENFKRYQVKGECIHLDGLKGSFDWVITNPPIRVGKEKMYELFDRSYDCLNYGGKFAFVIRKQHGAKSAQRKCMELFGNCELMMKDKGFYIYIAEKN